MKASLQAIKTGQMAPLDIAVESMDDLWVLYNIISLGDHVRMRTMRKLKMGDSDRSQNVVKKPMTLTLAVEKISLEAEQETLRVLGSVTEGPEDVPKGAHHSFAVQPTSTFTVTKTWRSYHLKQLKNAIEQQSDPILLVVCDWEKAILAELTNSGIKVTASLGVNKSKKAKESTDKTDLFVQLQHKIKDVQDKVKYKQIVIGSPSFWHKQISQTVKVEDATVLIATVSTADEPGLHELTRRNEVKTALQAQRAVHEVQLVEELLTAISKEEPHAYGLQECKDAAEQGAVNALLVTDTLLAKARDDGTIATIEQIMQATEQANGQVHIISHKHDGGDKLNGLSGIGAQLRYHFK